MSELRWMMRVFIVRGDVALPLESDLRLKVLLKSWRVFMFGNGSRDDVARGQWQMGRCRGAENLVCHGESFWTARLHDRVESAREIEVLLVAKEYEGSCGRGQASVHGLCRYQDCKRCSYKRGVTSYMLQYSFA